MSASSPRHDRQEPGPVFHERQPTRSGHRNRHRKPGLSQQGHDGVLQADGISVRAGDQLECERPNGGDHLPVAAHQAVSYPLDGGRLAQPEPGADLRDQLLLVVLGMGELR